MKSLLKMMKYTSKQIERADFKQIHSDPEKHHCMVISNENN